MRFLRNRIIISLAVVFATTCFWEFYVRPLDGPLYTAAVSEYKAQRYGRSLQLLSEAYRIDPNDTAILGLFGWDYLKSGKPSEAIPYFERSLRLNSRLGDAREGLAYCWLEMEDGQKALEYFKQLPPGEQHSQAVMTAEARAYRLLGNNQAALGLAVAALRANKENKLARKELVYLTGIEDLEVLAASQMGHAERAANLIVAARLQNGFFEILKGKSWKRIYVAGVDIGPATPGHFASEPPTEMSVYLDWLESIGGMGANTVRVYTLLPPAFYRALLTYNIRNPRTPLYLFQEIWLKDPPDDNLFSQGFTEDFQTETRNVIDALHGQASLPIEKGHAGGIYTSDVSAYVLGWLIGREVEPHVVITTDLRNPGVKSYAGRYLKITDGNPSEVWFTKACDFSVDYEVTQYNWQRPVAWVNWPPLDPLTHPSDNRLIDELRIRRARGEKVAPLGLGVQDDLDAVSLDEEKVSTQPGFQAGYFALYHVYPFWPDFIFSDPAYRDAQDKEGLNSYWGYLEDLKKHYQRTPILIGEYGISTSIGVAHFNPNGWNHGGLDEVQQGRAILRLTKNIKDAGFAGGMIFEWIDEWWKHNWIAVDWEKPFSRKALWHNDLDPEQSFGISKYSLNPPPNYTRLGTETPIGAAPPTSPGDPEPFRIRSVLTASDPTALYIDLPLDVPAGAEPDWSRDRYLIALNTCDAPCGSGTLPFVNGVGLESGANFVVHLSGPEKSRLLVASKYNPYRDSPAEGLPLVSDIIIPRNFTVSFDPGGRFVEMVVETNRRRYGKDGTFYPSQRYSRSLLRYGVFDPSMPGWNSLGQWYFDKDSGRIRLRLSWGLLLVLDPSQGLVFQATDDKGETVGRVSHQIQIAAIVYAGEGPPSDWVPTQIVAKAVAGRNITQSWSLPWPTWSAVSTKSSLKQSYSLLAPAFSKLIGYPVTK